MQKNPEIRFYEAEIAAALGSHLTAGQLANPELITKLGSMHVYGQGDGLVWRVQIAQVFDFPGRLSLRKAIADRDITLAELGLAQFKVQRPVRSLLVQGTWHCCNASRRRSVWCVSVWRH